MVLQKDNGCAHCGEYITLIYPSGYDPNKHKYNVGERFIPTIYAKTNKGQEIKFYVCKDCHAADLDLGALKIIKNNMVANEEALADSYGWSKSLIDPLREIEFEGYRKVALANE